MRILVTGASGSGTSTLGKALAANLTWGHVDLDDFYWMPTRPPFREKRDFESRLALLRNALGRDCAFVLSGLLMEWGLEVEDSFALIVFLTVPASVRAARLEQREIERYGMRDEAFLAWDSQYDEGRLPGRSRQRHEAWLAKRTCPILCIDGTPLLGESLATVLRRVSTVSQSLRDA